MMTQHEAERLIDEDDFTWHLTAELADLYAIRLRGLAQVYPEQAGDLLAASARCEAIAMRLR